jgi:hypothetical protein
VNCQHVHFLTGQRQRLTVHLNILQDWLTPDKFDIQQDQIEKVNTLVNN